MENRIDWRGATLATIAILGLPVILAGFIAGFFFELLRIGFNANSALFDTLTDDPDDFARWVEQVMEDHDLDDPPMYESEYMAGDETDWDEQRALQTHRQRQHFPEYMRD